VAVLIDLISAEVSTAVSYNGGSEYVKSVALGTIDAVGPGHVHLLRSRTGSLEPSFANRIRLTIPAANIHFIEDWPTLSSLVAAIGADTFFIGIFQRYRSYLPFLSALASSLRVVCVVHDLVEFETTPGPDQVYFERLTSFRTWLGAAKQAAMYLRSARRTRAASRALFTRLSSRFDMRWVVPSEYTKSALLLHLGAASRTIEVLWSPPSPNQLLFLGITPAEEAPEGAYLVLGANRWSKNLLCALRAGAILRSAGHKFRLIVVGNFESTPIGQYLSRLSWVDVRPYGEPEAIGQVLSTSRALLFPTLCEGFGYPPLEAMCLQRPTIAAATSSVPEITGEAALYFSPHSPSQLAHQVMALDRNRALLPSGLALRELGLRRIARQQRDYSRLLSLIAGPERSLPGG
jgi:glycosyltransferase involved in cell wall biosynthesis